MPELPEVEIAGRCLGRWLVGHRIVRAVATPGRPLRGTTPAEVSAALAGRTARTVRRLGKHLLVGLDDGQGVHLHLGMTGKLVRRAEGSSPPRQPRVTLELADGQRLHLVDPRRFGRFELGPLEALLSSPELRELGP
ncbi:MAG: DNA-formamidopyrimidine glycosylase family protein, partial [Deltaproteobacteria bacterium]